MEKRGQIGIVIVVTIVIIGLTIGIITWQLVKTSDKPSNATQETDLESNLPKDTSLDNETAEEDNNETENGSTNETETIGIPNPTGSISVIDHRGSGEYSCNYTKQPEHRIRLYTYKIIDGTKTLSDDYIESARIYNICNTYSDIDENSTRMYYYLEWKWDYVENIDGYRIYQEYFYQNDTRDYDHYVELKAEAQKLIDTSLDLWVYKTPINSS